MFRPLLTHPTSAHPFARLLVVAACCMAVACATPGPNSGSGEEGTLPGETPGTSTQPLTANANMAPAGPGAPTATSPNSVAGVPVVTAPATVPGTNVLANGNDSAVVPTAAIVNPNINFDGNPPLDKKAVALTFDDGPDGAQGATTMVLDTLKKENLKATFFLCANIGFGDLATDTVAQAQLKRIIAEGHQTANHTHDHKNLATLSVEEANAEFQQLEDVYNKVLGPTAPKMTMVRTPFGSPFQLDNPNTQRLAPTVTKHGVQIGWGMDPKDWTFDHYSKDPTVFNADVQSVISAVQKLIDGKQWGIILLHAVHLPSATALPTVIKMLRDNGYHFVSVEDVVRAQYGANSASIMAANRAAGTAL